MESWDGSGRDAFFSMEEATILGEESFDEEAEAEEVRGFREEWEGRGVGSRGVGGEGGFVAGSSTRVSGRIGGSKHAEFSSCTTKQHEGSVKVLARTPRKEQTERLTSISLKSSSFSSLVVSQTCSNSMSNALSITPTFSLSRALSLSPLSFPLPLLPRASSRGVLGVKGEAGVKGDSGEGSVEGVDGKREEE